MDRIPQKPSFEEALRERLDTYVSRPKSRREVGQGRLNLIETAKPITDAIIASPEDVTQTLDAAMLILFEYLGHDNGDSAVNSVLEMVVVQMMLEVAHVRGGSPQVVAVGETAMVQNIVTLAEYLPKKEAGKGAVDTAVEDIVQETRDGKRGKRTKRVRPL
ncbi:MAG: hypothetical protein WCT36_05885 [Candidatus Gracilibacteria bacterium]|jgi:hypothetical protein